MKRNSTKENVATAHVEKTTLQKQYIFIIIAACLLVLFLIFYFAIYPLLKKSTNNLTYLYDGEAIDKYGQLCIVTPHERKEISKIEVKNEHGIYTLNAYTANNGGREYKLEGGGKVVLDAASVAGVVTSAGQPLAVSADKTHYRADEYATKEDLKKYGLDEEADPSWVRVTLDNGTSYRLMIGNALPAGNGYYAMLDDETRRNVVENEDGTVSEYYIIYILEATTSKTLLSGDTAIVSLQLGDNVGTGIYSTKEFRIDRIIDGKRDVVINIKANDGVSDTGMSTYKLIYPAGYMLNEDHFYDSVLAYLANIQAELIVTMGDKIYSPEVYEEYGLDLDRARLESGEDKNYAVLYYKCLDGSNKNDYENKLYFSERKLLSDGTYCYYVYVPEYDVIALVRPENFDFISWASMKYTDARIFFSAIGSLDYFSLLSSDGKTDVRFSLTGTAYTYHVDVTNAAGNRPLTGNDGKSLVYDVQFTDNGIQKTFEGPFENFRDLYYVLITRTLDTSENLKKLEEGEKPVYTIEAQTVLRDRSEQYYKYENDQRVIENKRYVTVEYDGGYVLVNNLKGISPNGYELTYENAYYDEKSGKYFVKAEDTADGEMKPRNYKYEDGKLIPVFLNISNATAEYTVSKYGYEIYNMYNEVKNPDGTVTKTLSHAYMMVVPTVTESVYRIEADGTRTLISSVTSENDGFASVIRKTSIEKLFSDTAKVLAGQSIDRTAID